MSRNLLTASVLKLSAAERTANLGWILLFPGFALYHVGVNNGWIPNALGGFFAPIAVLLAGGYFLLIPQLISAAKTAPKPFLFLWIALIVYIVIWSLVHATFSFTPQVDLALIQALETVGLWIPLVLIGWFVPLRSKSLKWTFGITLGIFVGLFLYVFLATGEPAFYRSQLYSIGEGTASYQGLARSIFIMILLLLSTATSLRSRIILTISGFFSVFMLGARSELIAFTVIAILLWCIWSLTRPRYLIAFGAIAFVFAGLAAEYSDLLQSTRHLDLLSLSESSSWLERQNMLNLAWKQFSGSPVFGVFGGHVSASGSTGNYAHNVLSAFVNFGLMGGLLYTALILYAFIHSTRKIVAPGPTTPEWTLSFSINATTILLIFTLKSVFWIVPALGWGVFLAASMRDLHQPRYRTNQASVDLQIDKVP